MYKVLGLNEVPNTEPQVFELVVKDPENTKKGYLWRTEYGTEPIIPSMLRDGGMSAVEVNSLLSRT